jgi:hypothetical protein
MMRYNRLSILAAFAFTFLASTVALAQDAAPAAQKPAASAPATTKKKTAAKPKAPASEPLTLEPKAVEILKAAGNKLASAKTLTFTAVETFESLSRQGVPLVYANRSEVVLERPNKLRVILTGDGPASEFYYDGKIVMAYAPAENLVAVADAQPTIDKTLEAVYHSAGIYFPFTDLIVADPYGDLAPEIKHAYYVGQSNLVGGITTDIIAIAGNGVFMQIWIGAEDKLPRGIHAIYLDDPDRLRHNLILSDWKLDATVSDDFFTATKASTAKKMEFAHPHPETPARAKPLAKTPPAKSTAPAKTNPSQPQQ